MRGAAVVAGLALALAGCSGSGGPLLPDPGTSTPAAPSPSTADTSSPAETPTARSCFDRVLGAKTVHLKGSKGSVSWDLAIPEFSGAASASAVNRHVRASAQDAIDLGLREAREDDGVRRSIAGEAKVTTSDRRTVQVELQWIDNLAGTAHPSDDVATTVVTTADGTPVRLSEVLVDETASLKKLARVVADQLDVGVVPTERNFAAWQTTRDGMRFVFTDDQVGGRGNRDVTVPWSTVRPLLSDEGTGLLDPDIDPTTC